MASSRRTNGSYTATLSPTSTTPDPAAYAPHPLSSSVASLASSASARIGIVGGGGSGAAAQQHSAVSKTYRQASTLFLTRRLPEALSTILPLVTPPPPPSSSDDEAEDEGHAHPNGNGAANGDFFAHSSARSDGSITPTASVPYPERRLQQQQPLRVGTVGTLRGAGRHLAPVARASRHTRVRIWSLYLTILNAVLELSAEEGKEAFGARRWRELCASVREGDVWEQVVRDGYGGREGDVDSDVVVNLATLLLAHAPTQHLNQRRLEAYLASSTTPNLDLNGHFMAGSSGMTTPRATPYHSRHGRSSSKASSRGGGTDTPRDLNARVKILELYTLHVLLRNDEWDYAREFINATAVLDDERREAFLAALQSLRDDQIDAEKRERERREQHQRQKEEEAAALRERRRKGKEERPASTALRDENQEAYDGVEGRSSRTGPGSPSAAGPVNGSAQHARRNSGTSGRRKVSGGGILVPPPSKGAVARSGKTATVQPTFAARAAAIITNLRTILERLAASVHSNPLPLMKTLAFIVAIVLMFSRSDVRLRISRILGISWQKLMATVAMGGKVSYI